MLEAAFWGLVTAGSLWVGAVLAAYARPTQRLIGLAMAFGAGALIAAVAYELVIDAFETDLVRASIGFACGALVFYVGDTLIDRMGGAGRKSLTGESQLAGSASAIVLGTVLDGIPESFVRVALAGRRRPDGRRGGRVRLQRPRDAFRVSRAASGGVDAHARVPDVELRRCLGRRGRTWLLHPDKIPTSSGAFVTAFAAGALLVMLADTLMPEAFELGGREAGLVTALGFAVGFGLS